MRLRDIIEHFLPVIVLGLIIVVVALATGGFSAAPHNYDTGRNLYLLNP